jgi:hypothetical protein
LNLAARIAVEFAEEIALVARLAVDAHKRATDRVDPKGAPITRRNIRC